MISLSNLYKQQFVRTQEDGKRIINSNILVRQMVEEQAKALLPQEQETKQEPSEEFVEGLAAPEVELIDYEAQAREEAEQIIEQAHLQAQQILEEARGEAEQLKQQAMDEGKDAGYDQGMSEANQTLKEQLAQLEEQRMEQQREYEAQLQKLEPLLLHTVTDVVEKVFKIQFHDKEEIMLYLVKHTIESIDGAREFTIKASPVRAAYLEEHRQEILSNAGHNISLDIVTDHTFGEGDCVIETDTGFFECGPDTQIENLIKDIKSLCV